MRDEKQICNAIMIPLFIIDDDKKIQYLSPEMEPFFKLPLADFLQQPLSFLYDHFLDETRHPLYAGSYHIENAFQFQGSYYMILMRKWNDETQLNAEAGYFIPVCNAFINQELLFQFMQKINTGICLLSSDCDKVLLANNRFYENIMVQEEMYEDALFISSLMRKDEYARIKDIIKQTKLKDEKSFTFDMKFMKKDNSELWLNVKGYIWQDYGLEGLLCVFNDMSSYKRVEQQLKLNEQRYRFALTQTDHVIWEYDLHKGCICPQTYSNFLFCEPANTHNVPESSIRSGKIDKDCVDDVVKMFSDIKKGVANTNCIVKIYDDKQNFHWYKITHTLMQQTGSTQKAIGIAENVTDFIETQHLYEQEGIFRSAIAGEALISFEVDVDADKIIQGVKVNDSQLLKMVNVQNQHSYNLFLKRWAEGNVCAEDRISFVNSLSSHKLQESYYDHKTQVVHEFRCLIINDSEIWCRYIIHLIQRPHTHKLYAYIYIHDIDAEKRKELELIKNAQIDSLTNIFNRTTIQKKIEEYLVCAKGVHALFVIDVDNFKEINDTFGHFYGDKVLENIAQKLNSIFRKNDYIGRFGGDEFLVFMPDIGNKDIIAQKASIIAKELDLIYRKDSNQIRVTTSAGIAFSPEHGITFEELFDKADRALYKAKKQGKSNFLIYGESSTPLLINDYVNKEWLIDELDDVVYISDIDTYNLIYVNKIGRERCKLKTGEYSHKKCYQVLQGRDSPCLFCTNSKLRQDCFYVWELKNSFLQRDYIVKDKLIQWNGKPARMEIAVDVTDGTRNSFESKVSLEKTMLACLQSLSEKETLQEAIVSVLKIIADFYHGERSYIVEIDENTKSVYNTYEYCQPNIKHQKASLQNIPFSTIPLIIETFQEQQNLIISQVEEMKYMHPSEYHFLASRNVHSLLAVPFKGKDTFSGYIGIDNPTLNHDAISLLDTIAITISNEIIRRRLYEKMIYNYSHDQLSGLLNHNSYTDYFEEAKHKKVKTRGIIVADINGLKQINRDRGHQNGDDIIKYLTKIMRQYFSEYAIFRLSGDEYTIICDDIHYDDFSDRVRNMKNDFSLASDLGVAVGNTWDDQNQDIYKLTHHAEELMIINKHLYYENSNVNTKHHSAKKVKELKDIIKKKYFILHLQPKVNSLNGEIYAAETLIRCQHPVYGLVPPSRFIPILEKEKLIRHLDFYVFEEICKMLQRWNDEGRKLIPISVNFSRITLLEEDFITLLHDIKSKYDVPCSNIVIEITESAGNMEQKIISVISADIKRLGFKLSLDDFGSDYANLSILPIVAFDELKLDKSMIDNLVTNLPNQTIVKCIIEMCNRLQIACVAEGVETIDQLNLLKSIDCHLIQGFYFSQPLSISEFEKLEKFTIF